MANTSVDSLEPGLFDTPDKGRLHGEIFELLPAQVPEISTPTPDGSEAKAGPYHVDAAFDPCIHRDGNAPFAAGLAGPFVGGIEPHFRTEPGHRTREIQVIDRRIFRDQGIARRVDTGRDSPDHFLPVAHVDVVIHYDDELGVHELAQVRPDAEHHALGVPGILLAH